jgi:hypothetical protein
MVRARSSPSTRGQGPTKDDTSAVMTPIAHALSLAQVSAIAAYLPYLR